MGAVHPSLPLRVKGGYRGTGKGRRLPRHMAEVVAGLSLLATLGQVQGHSYAHNVAPHRVSMMCGGRELGHETYNKDMRR